MKKIDFYVSISVSILCVCHSIPMYCQNLLFINYDDGTVEDFDYTLRWPYSEKNFKV